MSLFGSSSNTTKTSSKKIRPVVVRTQNVAKELLLVSKNSDVSVHSLDFNILDIQTFTRVSSANKEAEWEEIAAQELAQMEDMGAILDKEFQIKQMYEIEIFSKADDNPYTEFHLAVGANATKCKVYLSIKVGSRVSYNQRFEHELKVLINKSKIRANILIDVFDEMIDSVVSKIAAHVRVEENVVYDKNETFLIAESHEPTPTTDDELILHFDKEVEVSENEKKDYSDRNFIKSVKIDELLIEYIKPKEGKAGRNCRGEYMGPKEPLITNLPAFTVDQTIKVVEDTDSIKYLSVENGYITLDSNVYTIKSEVDISQISFKTTGSISTGLDSDVSIVVKEADAIKDAIGSGMEVEVSEIDIEGNVGPNAKVTALKAKIGGQTHKTAIVKADNLYVQVHKGTAYGKHVEINRLEHGSIDSDTVEIEQAIGGEIRAKEITIALCGSYVKATASRVIIIEKFQGSENVFTIDPLLKKNMQNAVHDNHDDIDNLKKSIKNIEKEIVRYTKMVKDNLPALNNVKKRLVHYKKSGVKMPTSFVLQYKKFIKVQEHLELIKKEYEIKKDSLILQTTKTASFQDSIFDARIINKDRWVGHNEIVFKLVDPPIELKYKVEKDSPQKVFSVVQDENEEYHIEATEE